MSGVICLNCEGWGCAACKHEREASKGGEQGLSPLEVELAGLRDERARLAAAHPHCLMFDDQPGPCTCAADRAALKADRDRLLAELALLRVPRGEA